jgi:hypothetical protein
LSLGSTCQLIPNTMNASVYFGTAYRAAATGFSRAT